MFIVLLWGCCAPAALWGCAGEGHIELSLLQGFLVWQHPATSRLAAPDRIPVGACTCSQRLSSLIPSNLWSSPVQLPVLFKATQGLDGNKEHQRISQGALGNVEGGRRKKKKRGATLNLEFFEVVAVHLTLKGQILLSEGADSWSCAEPWLLTAPHTREGCPPGSLLTWRVGLP